MIGAVLLQSADISTGDVSHWQETIAWVVLVLFAAGYVGVRLYARYGFLEDHQRRHLREIRPAIAGATWHRITITDDEDRTARFETVAQAMGANGGLEHSTGGVRAALADVREWLQRQAPVAVPPLAVRGFVEGLLVLALAGLIAAPAAWWQRAFGTPDGGLSVSATVSLVLEGVVTVGGWLAWLLEATVPGGDVLAALGLTAAVLLAQLLASLAVELGVALVVGAVVVAYLDHLTAEDLSVTLYPNRRLTAGTTLAGIVAVWLAAAVPTVGGRLVAAGLERAIGRGGILEWVGAGIGVLAGLVAAGVLAYIALWDLRFRLYHRQSDPESTPHAVAAYLVARKLLGVAFVVTLPVLLWLAARAVTTGALARPFAALAATPWWGRVILLAAPIAVGAYLSTYADGRAADHLRAFRHWVAVRVIQSAGFARGVSVASVVVGFLVGFAYVSLVAGLIGAAVAGVGVRSAQLLYERGRVRAGRAVVRSGPYLVGGTIFAIVLSRTGAPLAAAVFAVVIGGMALAVRRAWRRYGLGLADPERESRPPTDIVVEVPTEPIFDADGEPIYVARVDGKPLAARSRKRLFRDIQRIVSHRFETGETPELLGHAYYERVVDSGTVDETAAIKSVRGDLSTRVTATLQKEGGVECDVLEEELEDEYPRELIDPTLEELEQRQQIGVRDGQYVPVS